MLSSGKMKKVIWKAFGITSTKIFRSQGEKVHSMPSENSHKNLKDPQNCGSFLLKTIIIHHLGDFYSLLAQKSLKKRGKVH